MSPRVAIATCSELPQLADDEPMLLDALRARGVEAEPAVWDDPAVDWDRFDLVVVRSTWDYASRREAFVRWAERVPRVLNSPDVIRWNTDKRYLTELPWSVTTELVAPGDMWAPPEGEYVLKPTISSGSRDTARYGHGDEARARDHMRALLEAGRTAMVQPYLDAVDHHGETALLFFAGEYSHAIRKGQMLRRGQAPTNGLYRVEEIGPRDPDPLELSVADDVLDALPWPRQDLLYARIDLIRGEDGRPRLVELELTEPSLFFSYGDGAADALAQRIVERL